MNKLFGNKPERTAYAKFRKFGTKRNEEMSCLSTNPIDAIMTANINSFQDAASLSPSEQLSANNFTQRCNISTGDATKHADARTDVKYGTILFDAVQKEKA